MHLGSAAALIWPAVGQILASADQYATFHQAFDRTQLQECHGGAAYVGRADEISASEPEVIGPLRGGGHPG